MYTQHPLETATWFSLCTWAWLFPLLQAGKLHPLEAEDVPPLPRVHTTAAVRSRHVPLSPAVLLVDAFCEHCMSSSCYGRQGSDQHSHHIAGPSGRGRYGCPPDLLLLACNITPVSLHHLLIIEARTHARTHSRSHARTPARTPARKTSGSYKV